MSLALCRILLPSVERSRSPSPQYAFCRLRISSRSSAPIAFETIDQALSGAKIAFRVAQSRLQVPDILGEVCLFFDVQFQSTVFLVALTFSLPTIRLMVAMTGLYEPLLPPYPKIQIYVADDGGILISINF